MLFNSYGFRTLIIWDDELSDEALVVSRIKALDRREV